MKLNFENVKQNRRVIKYICLEVAPPWIKLIVIALVIDRLSLSSFWWGVYAVISLSAILVWIYRRISEKPIDIMDIHHENKD